MLLRLPIIMSSIHSWNGWCFSEAYRHVFEDAADDTDINVQQVVVNVTVYGKIGHNAACVNVAKRSI